MVIRGKLNRERKGLRQAELGKQSLLFAKRFIGNMIQLQNELQEGRQAGKINFSRELLKQKALGGVN